MLLKMLFILFIGLKLGNVIDWSWWLVCIPAIILVVRWIFVIIFKESIRAGEPWAIKLYTYMHSK